MIFIAVYIISLYFFEKGDNEVNKPVAVFEGRSIK